jgi:hypothetical protein
VNDWANYAVGGAVGVLGLILAAGYTRSAKAQKLGLTNLPDEVSDVTNLAYSLTIEPEVTEILRERFPTAELSSVYRNDAVNRAVGGVDDSFHEEGLAWDYKNVDPVEAARHLRRNAHRLPAVLRTVIAESTPIHLHVDIFPPNGATRATKWLMESGGENNFVPLT